MKRRLWFLGSVFAMLLILAMWFITLRGYTGSFCSNVICDPGPDHISCRTLYGFGDEIKGNVYQHAFANKYNWIKYYLPPLKFGWVLFIFAIYQWLILFRKFRRKTKKTKQFAIGVRSTTNKDVINDTQFDKPGGFLFDLKYFRLFAYIQVTFAVLIFIGNTLCVVISKNLKYILYSNGFAFESIQLNIEYIFPGVLYLTATLISVYCLNKYIEASKLKDKLDQR